MCINMARIFSIQIIKEYGIILLVLQSLTVSQTARLQIIMVSYILCHLICIHSIRCGGVVTPEEAAAKIEEQKKEAGIAEPKNLEEQAISPLVGRDIFEKLIKGYTEKQWGRDCKDLPAFIIKRLPVRLTFDNNYFNALYQGIPVGGYTKMVANMSTEWKFALERII